MTMDALARYAGASVLAVGAHPDDLEVGAGGTLARLARGGSRVVMAVVAVPTLRAKRTEEARRAAEALGCELRVLTDGERHVEDMRSYELVGLLDALVRELSPSLLIAHASCDHHRDHLLAGGAARATLRLGGFDYWRYSTSTHTPVCGAFQPTLFVDVTSTIEAKLSAVAAHESQFTGRGIPVDGFRQVAREQGRMGRCEYAEAFEVGRMLLS